MLSGAKMKYGVVVCLTLVAAGALVTIEANVKPTLRLSCKETLGALIFIDRAILKVLIDVGSPVGARRLRLNH